MVSTAMPRPTCNTMSVGAIPYAGMSKLGGQGGWESLTYI